MNRFSVMVPLLCVVPEGKKPARKPEGLTEHSRRSSVSDTAGSGAHQAHHPEGLRLPTSLSSNVRFSRSSVSRLVGKPSLAPAGRRKGLAWNRRGDADSTQECQRLADGNETHPSLDNHELGFPASRETEPRTALPHLVEDVGNDKPEGVEDSGRPSTRAGGRTARGQWHVARKLRAGVFLALLLVLATVAQAQVNKPTFNTNGTLNKTAGIGITQKLGADVPLDITFKDETGASVRLSQYFGRRPVLLNLIFYKCPGMCSLELEGLVNSFAKMSYVKPGQAPGAAHTLIGSDVDVVTVSIDPNEGPVLAAAKKQTVLENFDYPSAKLGWHFLTGDLENLNRLASAVGFAYTYNPDSKAISHPAGIILLSPSGKVTQYFYGTGYPEKPLHDAIALAATNTVGPKADVILLGCLSHDAMTGKYSVNVERTTQVLGGLTVLILALSIWRMGHKRPNRAADPGGVDHHG